MKILITGANGLLGCYLTKSLASLGEISPLSHDQMDITDRKAVFETIKQVRPDIIVHAAAITDVEKCEQVPEIAWSRNYLGTVNLVDVAALYGMRFVYISSTGCYGVGKKDKPYSEFDLVEPTTVHHKTKFEAEMVVSEHLSRYLIIRIGWLFGGSREHEKNFVWKRYLEAKDVNKVYSDPSQKGTPTYAGDVAHQLRVLLENDCNGLFNCVDVGAASRLDYVREILKAFGLDCEVAPAPGGMFNRIAPVATNESAVNVKLDMLGLSVMRPWREALAGYVNELMRGKGNA
ncbi:MAG: NAD(P)-dependent oxidoreductase [Desulfuromusa sp.]|nr:NAD(P)-dependent oxidoreductase [Desulfuromusa sp.]